MQKSQGHPIFKWKNFLNFEVNVVLQIQPGLSPGKTNL